MNYRTTHGFKPPFRVHTQLDADPASDTKALLTIQLGCQVGGWVWVWVCLWVVGEVGWCQCVLLPACLCCSPSSWAARWVIGCGCAPCQLAGWLAVAAAGVLRVLRAVHCKVLRDAL
jgi:hypothetical protein